MLSDSGSPIDTVLEKLAEYGLTRVGDLDRQWACRCPAHEDSSPSLSVAKGTNGKVLLKCFAGCKLEDICAAIGLTIRDLFPAGEDDRKKSQPDGLSVCRLAFEKRLLHEWLREACHVKDGEWFDKNERIASVVIPYLADGGSKLFDRFRFRITAKNGTRQPKGTRLALYGLWMLPTFRERGGPLVFVEGETDCWALWFHHINALGVPGASSAKVVRETDSETFAGFERMLIWQEPDSAGEKFAHDIGEAMIEHGFAERTFVIRSDEHKDPADVHARLADGFADAWTKIVNEAKPWEPGVASPTDKHPPHPSSARVIRIGTDQFRVNDEALTALATEQDLFQRGGSLVHLVEPEQTPEHAVRGSVVTPVIRQLVAPLLQERLSRCVRWEVERGQEIRPAHPPEWCVSTLLARGHWLKIRPLTAVVSHPVLLPDGTIHIANGYDESSGLFTAIPESLNLDLPEYPTRDHVAKAVVMLFDLVCDVPFANPAHRSAWLASLLTPLAMFAYRGPAPLFLIDANTAGAGKGLLMDVVSLIVNGETFVPVSYDHDSVEMRKKITSLAVEGERMVLIDNITGPFGNDALCIALTSPTWKGRILGVSKMFSGPLNLSWYATANNAVIGEDMERRICHIRIERMDERPEEKSDFKYLDLRGYVRANRGMLLASALTILRGWVVAGKPRHNLPAWGSYEGWSSIVREAIVFADQPDPFETRIELRVTADRAGGAMAGIIAGLRYLDPDQRGLTSAEMIDKIRSETSFGHATQQGMRDLESSVVDFCGKLDARTLGNKLKRYRRKNFGGWMIDCAEKSHGAVRWVVRSVGGVGLRESREGKGESGESLPTRAAEYHATRHDPESDDSPDDEVRPVSPGAWWLMKDQYLPD